MTVKGATSWSGTFVCKDATGALAAASVGPAGTLYLNGTSNAASVTISGSNPYKWTLTLPALSAGDRVDMYITATVGGIATAAIVASDAADTKRVSDLNDIAATAIVSGGAITTSSGAVTTVTGVTNAVTANVTQINGAATNGYNATLKLKQLDIQADANLDAIVAKGSGTGAGVKLVAGATASGIDVAGGGTSGAGIAITATNGHGISSTSGGNGNHGILAIGGTGELGCGIHAEGSLNDVAPGHGFQAVGGYGAHPSATSGRGINAIGYSPNAPGIHAEGGTTGPGMRLVGFASSPGLLIAGGPTGNGITVSGGGTSGDGINISTTNGDGISIASAGAGQYDIDADIHGTLDTVTTATNVTTALAKLKKWLQLLFRKDAAIAADNAVELAEINANMGTGVGAFANTTDSTEAIRDNMTTAPTVTAIADQVWDEAIAGHLNPGSTGLALNTAGAAADPLTNPVPGTYASGTAGAAIGSLQTGKITVVSPMSQDGLAVKLVRGDDYLNADGRALVWTDSGSNWPSLTGATVKFKWVTFSKSCTVIGAGGAHQQVSLDLTSAETDVLQNGYFDIEATLSNTHVVTLVIAGSLIIKDDV